MSSLNPFEIRASVQREVYRIVSGGKGLNPFEIRASVQPEAKANAANPACLNPFEIRASVQPGNGLNAPHEAWVSIPLKSGHRFNVHRMAYKLALWSQSL